jgi:hypothetical protein
MGKNMNPLSKGSFTNFAEILVIGNISSLEPKVLALNIPNIVAELNGVSRNGCKFVYLYPTTCIFPSISWNSLIEKTISSDSESILHVLSAILDFNVNSLNLYP